jgi:dinuclear metal center YbgI/SA1388 family protein
MKLDEVIAAFDSFAPPGLQEKYDNSGLVTGHSGMEIHAVLLCIDVTEAVLDEAIQLGADLIISHHPVLFNPLKRITGSSYTERIIITAIQKNIALYSAHTNLDNIPEGVNLKICQKLDLRQIEILLPIEHSLNKLVTFVPHEFADQVRSAMFAAGAGHIGKYDQCSFATEGQGSFRASVEANPFVGEIGKFHLEKEIRIETIFPAVFRQNVLQALFDTHPYEEVAYDIYLLENPAGISGAGMIGKLHSPVDEQEFLSKVKNIFHCGMIRHSGFLNRPVRKIAVCGGSGSFLIGTAISAGADMLLTADIKYHQFFEADGKLIVTDIGHFESERFTIEIFYEILTKKIPNFAIHFSRINTNCVNYF